MAIIADVFPCVSETFVTDHAVGLARRGFEVVVLCQQVDEERLPAVAARAEGRLSVRGLSARRLVPLAPGAALRAVLLGARHPRLAMTSVGRSLLLRIPLLAAGLGAARADVVHAHFASNGWAAALALRGRTPLIVDFHGWDLTVLPRIMGWRALRGPLRRATLVAHSTFAEGRVREGTGRTPRRVHLGVDPALFGGPARGGRWPRPLRLLCVGRLVAVKGLEVALGALADLVQGAPPLEARLRVVGEGPRRPALEALARQLGIEGRVQFVGARSHQEVAEEMAGADVLLVPSVVGADGSEECFGRVALEGLAAGLAVVTSDVGGLPETVGAAGWIASRGDPAALAHRIREAVRRGRPCDCAAVAVRQASRYSLARMAEEYAAVTHAALEGARSGPRA